MENVNEIKEYLKNAKERIESAEILMNAGKYNDAISRIYYSFFDAATAALLAKDLTAKTHHGLIVLFEENFIKTGEISMGVGRWLARAKEAREEADYEALKKFTEQETKQIIESAKEFVGYVKENYKF